MLNHNFHWTRFWAPEGVATQDHGFLPDPEGYFGDKRLIPFNNIVDVPCLILLGNPGIGKSQTLRQIAEQLKASGALCILKDFREFDDFAKFRQDIEAEPSFKTWLTDPSQTLHLFLDSLDEGHLEMRRLRYDLQRFLQNDLPVDRLLLRVSCRAAELPSDFLSLMQAVWMDKEQSQRKKVQVYTLTQLRERDVNQAALEHPGIDAEAFLQTVRRLGIEAFAAYPVTLVDMLFRIFEADPHNLPTSRIEIYRQGCRELVSEVSQFRIDEKHIGSFDPETRLAAVRQLALLSIVGNRPRIVQRHVPDDSILRVQDCYLPEESSWNNPESVIVETLRTALFARLGEYYLWSHRSYGEYLAAEYIQQTQMPLEQLRNLFINPADPDQRISPKLHEVAAWLATMRDDVLDWLLHSEPLILVKSNTIQLTNDQKFRLVEYFIHRYNTDALIEERLYWQDLRQLNHAGLGAQLRAHLTDNRLSSDARKLCLDFAFECEITAIDDVLITLVLDRDETSSLRQMALRALENPKRQGETLSSLRQLVLQPVEYRADGDIVSSAIAILWPEHLSATELFERLRLQSMDEVVHGSPYDNLFRTEIINQLNEADLPVALDWVRQHATEREDTISFAGRKFVLNIMRRAWDLLDQPPIQEAFARAAWSRLTHFKEVLENERDFWDRSNPTRNYGDELLQDTHKRRCLLQSMLSVLTPEGLRNDGLLVLLLLSRPQSLPFITIDDVPWLLEQTRNSDYPERHWAYAYLLQSLVGPLDMGQYALIFEEYETGENAAIIDYFRESFEAIPLDSDRARAGRAILEKKREHQLQNLEKELKKVPLRDNILKWLEKAEKDSVDWWLLDRWLVTTEYGYCHELTWDLRNGGGWKAIQTDANLITRIIESMMKFIKEQNPYIGDADPTVPIRNRRPAFAGYRALFLVEVLGLETHLNGEDWRRWADAIVFNDYGKDKDAQDIEDLLLQRAFEHGAPQLLGHLDKILASEQDDYHIETLLRRFVYASQQALDQLLIERLELTAPKQELFIVLLAFLLRRNDRTAARAQELAILGLNSLSTGENELAASKSIIRTFASYSQNAAWWSPAWQLMKSDEVVAKAVMDTIADRHSPFLRYLSVRELYELYMMSAKHYAYADDINFRGGLVPERYTQQEWRDSVLREIVGRGSLESVAILVELFEQEPRIPEIGYLLHQAKANFRTESWVAPEPKMILNLVRDQNKRLARNADQLLDIVLKVLQEIQRVYRGRGGMKNQIWNRQGDTSSYRPDDEETFSDAIAEWLEEYLPRVIVNREPRVTQKPRSHDRTDVQVETFSDTGEPLMVIIEVKACWYKDGIIEKMQTQLVDQYISANSQCSHGIYLVGYFASKHWDADDESRIRQCEKHNKEWLVQNLEAKASALSAPKPIMVKPFVFDASW